MAKRRVRGVPSGVPTVDNKLLAALPSSDYVRLASRLEIVPVKLKQFVHRSGEAIKHVYFPGGGFFSEVTLLSSGEMVEVTTIGREGMAGGTAALDDEPVAFLDNGSGGDDHLLQVERRGLPPRTGRTRRILRSDEQLPEGLDGHHHAGNGVQRGASARTAAGPVAADGARSDRAARVSTHPGIRGDDVGCLSPHGLAGCGYPAKIRSDHLPAWTHRHRRSCRPGGGVVRMLRDHHPDSSSGHAVIESGD